jgi:hypothetical protein
VNRIIGVSDAIEVHERTQTRHYLPTNLRSWLVNLKDGDDYTHDLAGWGYRRLEFDRLNNRYQEIIELYDGTRIESNAPLTDHRSRGADSSAAICEDRATDVPDAPVNNSKSEFQKTPFRKSITR